MSTDPTRSPVIVDAARTPFGRREGWLSGVHAAELLGHAQRGVIDRVGIDPGEIEQAIGGCVTPAGEQYGHITRTSWLHAGLPPETGATTIDAQCGTAAQSVLLLAGQIALGSLQAGLACGVELMSRVPLTPKQGTGLGTPRPADWSIDTPDQYTGADRIARLRGFSREDLDSFGLRSQQRARAAWDAGHFDAQIIPVRVPAGDDPDAPALVTRDQGLRETSMEALGRLRPVKDGGLHTAGTSSQISDGASAALLTSEERARDLGLRPRARLLTQCLLGAEPRYLLDGPVRAAEWLLKRSGMSIADIDLFEVNEAFASVPMKFAKDLEVPPEKINVNGGSIAMGHPLGATGAMILGTALDELERRDARYALATLCVGAGMGIATIIERL